VILSDADRRAVQERVERLEARTGVQLVAAVVPRSDAYPELPLRGFVAGATATALGLALAAALLGPPSRALAPAAPLAVLVAALVAGLASAWPALGRLLLDDARARTEMRQRAMELFLERECFATRRRTAVLLLVSLFERRVEILTDRGVRERLPDPALAPVVAAMLGPLRDGRVAAAFVAGLDVLEPLLAGAGFAGGGGENELRDEVVEEAAP
jgi:putative membrane protein